MTYKLGLTGGIATGKSTVSKLFVEAGYPLVDADVIAHEIVEPGKPALKAVAEAFGEDILQEDGGLDRKRLGAIVFSDPGALDLLNRVNRPFIRTALKEAIDSATATGAPLVVVDIPLLYETHWEKEVDGVLVVTLDEKQELERLIARDHLDEKAARNRIAAQMPLEEKVARADFVLDNGQGPKKRVEQFNALIAKLRTMPAFG